VEETTWGGNALPLRAENCGGASNEIGANCFLACTYQTYQNISNQILSNHIKSYQNISNHIKIYQIISNHISKTYQLFCVLTNGGRFGLVFHLKPFIITNKTAL